MGHSRRILETARRRRADEGTSVALEALVEGAGNAPLTMAIIAFTRFDIVNVAFGRAAGDALLTAAIARIAEQLPEGSLIERGDGATVRLALSLAAGDAVDLIDVIERGFAQPFAASGVEARLGIRIGVAHRAKGEPASAVLRRAADALLAAHAAEGTRVRIAAAPDAAPAERLAADLHRAIERREIDVLFQPQVSLRDGRVTGVEALARWEHPEHGVLGAEPLFAAADRADLGLALSEHIQTIALARAAAWEAPLSYLRIAVNVTASELARQDFAERFLGRVRQSGLDPQRVTAEVTETGMIAHLAAAAAQLAALREAGIRTAIDDFGTGYSSLAYLTSLPLDYVKIDRALTQEIDRGTRASIVVRGVLHIAADLGLRTIAEGVETATQRDLLVAEGCTMFQGFLCAGPLDDAALAGLITRGAAC